MTAAAIGSPPVAAQPGVQPAGAQIPDGPAKAWLVADMDTGQALASSDPNGSYAPASTIKPLLAMVVLDHLRPDNFARANESDTPRSECSCARRSAAVHHLPLNQVPPESCNTRFRLRKPSGCQRLRSSSHCYLTAPNLPGAGVTLIRHLPLITGMRLRPGARSCSNHLARDRISPFQELSSRPRQPVGECPRCPCLPLRPVLESPQSSRHLRQTK